MAAGARSPTPLPSSPASSIALDPCPVPPPPSQPALTCPPVSPQKEVLTPPPPAGITRSKSKHELKLLEKIPDNAEATVVLVGKGW